MNFHEAAKDIKGLGECLQNMREDLTSEAVSQGQLVAEKLGVSEPRTRKKKMMPGETAHDETISPTKRLQLKMKAVIDRLIAELKGRFERLENQDRNFGFLLDVKFLLEESTPLEVLKKRCQVFAETYNEINAKELANEIIDAAALIRQREEKKMATPVDLLKFIIHYGVDAFPNLRTSLQLLLVVATSIASCERSFSTLKLVLSYLRASMTQGRLSDLALISANKGIASALNFQDLINKFASAKARKILV